MAVATVQRRAALGAGFVLSVLSALAGHTFTLNDMPDRLTRLETKVDILIGEVSRLRDLERYHVHAPQATGR